MKDYEENENLEKAKQELDAFTDEDREFFAALSREIAASREKALRSDGYEDAQETIAREMLKNGESIEKIIKYTNLTKEEIEKLI